MKRLSPLVFFGTEDFSATILQKMLDSGLEIEAVITKPDLRIGRGRQLRPTKVKALALTQQIKVFTSTNNDELRQAVKQTQRRCAVLASFGRIIPEDVIQAFHYGIINVHPSLLPLYRGATPIESVILNGDKSTGVSIMQLNKELDAGAIYGQSKLPLNDQETTPALYQTLAKIGGDLLIHTLQDIANGLEPKAQDSNQATYCRTLTKSDALLDPSQDKAINLERKVRAYLKWPKARIKFQNHEIIILSASVTAKPKHQLSFLCVDERYFNLETVLSPSGKPSSAQQYYHNFLA